MSDNIAIAMGTDSNSATQIGHSIIVPINPQSHLMYYLSCVNTLLKPKGEQTDRNMRKLCDFKNYSRLTEQEVDKLLLMCFLLSPDELLNKCMFVCDELTKDFDNNFYEINTVSRRFVVHRELLIGGERREVSRIMACRLCWLHENWFSPMEHYKERLQRVLSPGSRPRSRPTTAPAPRPTTAPAPRPTTTPASRPTTTPASRPTTTPAPRPTTSGAPARPSSSQGNQQQDQSRSICTIS